MKTKQRKKLCLIAHPFDEEFLGAPQSLEMGHSLGGDRTNNAMPQSGQQMPAGVMDLSQASQLIIMPLPSSVLCSYAVQFLDLIIPFQRLCYCIIWSLSCELRTVFQSVHLRCSFCLYKSGSQQNLQVDNIYLCNSTKTKLVSLKGRDGILTPSISVQREWPLPIHRSIHIALNFSLHCLLVVR